jgi:sulfur-oxidizing protein SoxY
MTSGIHPGMTTSALPRRCLLLAGAALMAGLGPGAARATPEAMAAAVAAFTGGARVHAGKVKLDIAPLVENGNAVPVTITVDSPMTPAEHVLALALFNERNPQPEVIRVRLGPQAGRAQLSTRIRLATTQRLLALAQLSDGSFWSGEVEVIVTLAACIEGEV